MTKQGKVVRMGKALGMCDNRSLTQSGQYNKASYNLSYQQ
jgi:hypothetical protein